MFFEDSEEIFRRIIGFVPAHDLLRVRAVNRMWKMYIDQRIVGPFVKLPDFEELAAAKDSVTYFEAMALAVKIRAAQRILVEFGVFCNSVRPLSLYEQKQRIGQKYDGVERVTCVFFDRGYNEIDWEDVVEDESDDEETSNRVSLTIEVMDDINVEVSAYLPLHRFDAYSGLTASFASRGFEFLWQDVSFHTVFSSRVTECQIYYKEEDTLVKMTRLFELIRLALLHEGNAFRLPRWNDHTSARIFRFLDINAP
jgi:hypothetical protein